MPRRKSERKNNKALSIRSVVILLAACAFVLSAAIDTHVWAKVSKATAPETKKEEKAAEELKTMEALKEFLASLEKFAYHYDPEGKVDPFIPFEKKEEVKLDIISEPSEPKEPVVELEEPLEEEILTGLQALDPSQLILVGTIFGQDDYAVAIVENAAGEGFFLRVGDKLRHGEIHAIQSNGVQVKQRFRAITGGMEEKIIEMVLRLEGD